MEQITQMEKEKVNEQISSKYSKNKTRNIIVFVVSLISVLIAYIMFRGSYLETLEIGENYINIFWQNVKGLSLTLILNFLVIYFMTYLTNLRIRDNLIEFFKDEKKEMVKLPNKSIAFIIAILVSAFTSKIIFSKALLCFNSTLFGESDPVLGYDIGYFMLKKPFIELIVIYFLVAIIIRTVYAALYYIITFNMFFDGIDRKTLKNSKIINGLTSSIMKVAILIAGIVCLKTQNVGLQNFLNIKQETSSFYLVGAGLTDVTIKLWGYRILSFVIIISVFIAIKAFKKGKTKIVLFSILAVPLYLVVLLITMIGFDVFFVNSNELDKDKKYIQNNIDYTRNAYGIDAEEIYIENGGTITKDSIEENSELLDNVAIISKDIILKDLQGSQTSKGYYLYRNSQIEKYQINNKQKLVYVSPREVVSANGTYNNKTYEYTHGYGAIITSAASTNANGNAEHLQKSFQNTNEAINITEPRIYFGLETKDTVVTNSKNKKEFDYPVLDSNVIENKENIYIGKAGLQLNFIDRLILSIKEGDLKLALSSNVTKESKILTNRNIIERAKKIMPYLLYDENPYLVINSEGKMIWVVDAYTTSSEYPYSQRTVINSNTVNKKEINYIRNSVKVLIDSYDGTIKFYITDKNDPIIMAYKKIYKECFTEEEIPSDISSHFIYPEFLYNIQAEMMTKYHNVKPDVLYRSDDIWDIARHNTGKVLTKNGTKLEPYYTMLKESNSDKLTLGLVVPYTPYGKQNITSYLVGKYDENGNSKLVLYKFATDSNILGPMQLDTQIEQDETISKQIEALNVNGTKLTKNMIVVPINNMLLYIETIYQQSLNEGETALPTLKKIVVASGNKLAIGDNLKEALANLVSQYAVDIEVENTDNVEDLINAIIKANKNLEKSTNVKDWEMMGKDLKKLQELIKKLEEVQNEEEKNNKIQNSNNSDQNKENENLEEISSKKSSNENKKTE